MAYSYIRYTGNGSTTNFAFSFPYLSADHISVRVNDVVTAFTFLNSSTVTVSPAPASGAVVEVRRTTPKDTPIVDFTDGSVLLEGDLDLLATYSLYLAQEADDTVGTALAQNFQGVFDAQGKRIINVGTPTAGGDAVNKTYADAVIAEAEAAATAAGAVQVSLATAQAVEAASSALAASGSASAAAGSASSASASAISASASASSAAALLDGFDDRYLGSKAADPSVDNDGDPLVIGALYFNTASNRMKVYTSGGWVDTSSAAVASLVIYEYIATAGQSTFSGVDANGVSLSYTVGSVLVTLNGLMLRPGDDFTATSGTSIILASAATIGDELQVHAFSNFSVADAYTKAESNALLALKANDSWTQTGTGAVATTVHTKLRESVSVKDFGAVGDGVTNDTAAFQAALLAADAVFIPAGDYKITDELPVRLGCSLYGAGRHNTRLLVGSGFNMLANGVISLGYAETGATVEDIGIYFDQPDTSVRASLTQYPPAFYAVSTPRFTLKNIRIEAAWNGIKMTGNSGGSVIHLFESSCFNTDIDIDGSLDSVKISKLHVWPFGLTTRPLLYGLYEDVLHTGIKSGRCDDFHLTDSILFTLRTATNFYNSASGNTFGVISATDFDDRGGLNVSSGSLSVTGCYFTIGKTDAVVANITGGSVALTGCQFLISALPSGGSSILVSGADTQVVVSGCVYNSASLDARALAATVSARLNVSGSSFNRDPNVAYTAPTILYDTARGACTGNTSNTKGTGAGVFVQVVTDTEVTVTGNETFGWSYAAPGGALTNLNISPGPQVLNVGTTTATTTAAGRITFNHGCPFRPKLVLPIVNGAGGFVHVQVVSITDTQCELVFFSNSGAVIASSAIGFSWGAFG